MRRSVPDSRETAPGRTALPRWQTDWSRKSDAHRSMPPCRGERMTATERSPVKAQALENLEQDREQAANHLPAP